MVIMIIIIIIIIIINVLCLLIFVLLCLKYEKVQSATEIYVHIIVLFNDEST